MPLYGPRWPLKIGREDTYELNNTAVAQVNYNLKCVLLTSPGENISDPHYGVGLRYYLFENNNVQTHNDIINNIKSQVSFYIANIDLIDVLILTTSEDIDENSLSIKIK